ncbi:hypothetical protein Tco_1328847 [Tanacetum coccineum]
MSSVVRRSLKKETSTLGEIVSLNYIKSNKNVINNMANENIPTPAPTRSDDQILPFNAWVPIRKSNYVLDLQKKQRNPIF